MRGILRWIHRSPQTECFAYLILAFGLASIAWIPVHLASRAHEQLGDLLFTGTFGPSVAAILLSYRGVRVPGSKLSSRIVCFSLTLLLCWAVLMAHASIWNELRLSLGARLLLLLPSTIPAWIVSTAFSRDVGVSRNEITFDAEVVCLASRRVVLVPSAGSSCRSCDANTRRRIAPSDGARLLAPFCALGDSGVRLCFFVGGGLSEEPGGRGFLLARLQDRSSPLVASLLVWFPWVLWHAPLDFAGYAGPTVAAYLRTRVFILIPLCIIITWVYNRCGKTILSAALFHSASNVAPDFIPSTEWAVWMTSMLALVVIVTDRMWQQTS